ncbi:MAG: hypothetical protein JST00_12035 [Deltaproteobacteria bacterium]|nr:hypothetical protein [Deltaproteobacteria bacterium]
MDAGVAWVLNLDADIELGAGEGPYTPKKSVLDAMHAWRTNLAARLLDPGDVLVDEATPRGAARGRVGRAFCPTPRALAMLERAGATPEPHPPVEVLRRVNGRAFSASLGPTLPGARFVEGEDAIVRTLTAAPPGGFTAWHVKSAFGMAGRGHRVITPAGELRRDDRDFLRAVLRHGHGVMIEPHVAIERELAIHGLLEQSGALRLGVVTVQRCDAHGAWVASEPLEEDTRSALSWAAALEAEARRAAEALHAAGYFGPFGVDAFTYRAPGGQGEVRLAARSEINARYSMGFPEGMQRRTVLRCGA